MDKLDESHDFELPSAMVDTEFDQIWHQYEHHADEKEKEAQYATELQTSELAIVVPPLAARGDRFDGVPMFHELAPGNAEEVIEGGVDSTEGAFTDGKHETSFGEHAMDPIILYRDALVGGGFERGA